jgi:RNA-directed DNA polymerase
MRLNFKLSHYRGVVDLDREKVFDRVNHDKLMGLVRERVSDRRVLTLIDWFLKAGVRLGEGGIPRWRGHPKGGRVLPLQSCKLFFSGLGSPGR